MRLPVLGLLLSLLSFAASLSATGSNVLVVIEEEADKNKYRQFWTDLEQRGFNLDYKSPKESSLSLFAHGEPAYSHLLLMAKSKGLGPALTPNLLVDFINRGSNIMLTLSGDAQVPSAIGNLLAELDISISPDRNSVVIDHFNYDVKSAGAKHDVLLLPSPNFKHDKNFFAVDNLVAMPRVVGQALGNASPLLASVLHADSTAYPSNSNEELEEMFAVGSQLSLVTAFQARNSARVTVLGSAEALEDKWFSASVQLPGGKAATRTSNQEFIKKLSQWAFKETGVLKAGPVRHMLNEPVKAGERDTAAIGHAYSDIYRIKNDVTYSIELSEWTGDKWTPFVPPFNDSVQLEVSMLSPFHRLNLKQSSQTENSTIFITSFRLPDQHGIFNFYVEYRRPFYTNVEEKRTVTVRHFAHDEWPRSFAISGAYPWISGIWVTIFGWLAFVNLWLFSKPAALQGKQGKR
ncbi:dolichyl-di-phosphooligosaccharide-protein glycotransferase [Piedraia hortae CBS 480.64]|uniref:Dolichyl-diphosphooligosaccharide--protein glycosyltransferase subunit WBP1 n=1 Tax=Piedraia hortae CBS 480.64 TaxID=1314780 RepID=A0A6A7BSE5_9PEZI|nr:dolichyl-di-phosphooligosaccharide-protein glycotransferase [Piedraia hortae CBS 480.64]